MSRIKKPETEAHLQSFFNPFLNSFRALFSLFTALLAPLKLFDPPFSSIWMITWPLVERIVTKIFWSAFEIWFEMFIIGPRRSALYSMNAFGRFWPWLEARVCIRSISLHHQLGQLQYAYQTVQWEGIINIIESLKESLWSSDFINFHFLNLLPMFGIEIRTKKTSWRLDQILTFCCELSF